MHGSAALLERRSPQFNLFQQAIQDQFHSHNIENCFQNGIITL